MIKRLLVANRGEVAVRVMATAAVLGIETVAVYPADDAACGHVARADTAVELPGTGVAAYLDVDAIIAAAAGAGCDTLHPGYGFLSERPELAARCAAAGLRFAGPDAEALALFGDKAATRARARELGVPVLAGTGIDPSREQVRDLLREHGAVMVKAVAGGGGRGLRPVTREEDLAEAMRRCASEAASAFGDGRVYAEQLLTGARHVEVQLLGDGTGAVAVLGDRDCSLQRRRQKLIEIAPAALGDAVRDAAGRGRDGAGRLGRGTAAWPPPSSSSGTRRSRSSRSTPGSRSSTRSPSRSPAWTWSSSGCASPTAPPWTRSPWTLGRGAAPGRGAGPGQRRGAAAGRNVPARRRHADQVRPAGRARRPGRHRRLPGVPGQPALRLAAGQGDHRGRHAGGGGPPGGPGAGRVRHRRRAHQRGPAPGAAAASGARYARGRLPRRARRRAAPAG